jgi:hypothetical protein
MATRRRSSPTARILSGHVVAVLSGLVPGACATSALPLHSDGFAVAQRVRGHLPTLALGRPLHHSPGRCCLRLSLRSISSCAFSAR